MMIHRSYFWGICFCMFMQLTCIENAWSQDAFTTAGGDATGGGGSASFSLGQPFYTFIAADSGYASQGVQQAWNVYVVGLEASWSNEFSIDIFPNPASSFIWLEVTEVPETPITYQLTDVSGKKLMVGVLNATRTKIQLPPLADALYFLNLLQNEIPVHSFRLLKQD